MGDLGSIPGLGRSSVDMDLTEAEDIKKRWHVHTEEIYKKVLMIQITTRV